MTAACGPDAAVVLVDLTVGAETSVTRGAGRHHTLEGVHTLDLGAPVDAVAACRAPVRRLVGGVVGASSLVLRPAARAAVPAVVREPAPAPGPGVAAEGVIDGIPPEILAAVAPAPLPVSVVAVQTDEPPPEAVRMVERGG